MLATPLPAPAQDTPLVDGVEWRVEPGLTEYGAALAAMEERAAAIAEGKARERIWLVEHPPLYTGGTSARPGDLIEPRFPVYATGRGGKYTYHGPGQRTGYLMLDLSRRRKDVRHFVHALEGWLIAALARLGISAYAVPDRVGIWTRDGGQEAKIGAIGVRVKRWVTFHGFAVNIHPDLNHFGGIVPCGLPEFPVTSARALGRDISMETFDAALALELGAFLRSLAAAA